jgi:hypothetical protein
MYLRLYTTVRPFVPGAPLGAAMEVGITYQDVNDVSPLRPADPMLPQPGSGPLILPSARDVRLRLRALGRPDPELKYFGSEAARIAQLDVIVPLRGPATRNGNSSSRNRRASRSGRYSCSRSRRPRATSPSNWRWTDEKTRPRLMWRNDWHRSSA